MTNTLIYLTGRENEHLPLFLHLSDSLNSYIISPKPGDLTAPYIRKRGEKIIFLDDLPAGKNPPPVPKEVIAKGLKYISPVSFGTTIKQALFYKIFSEYWYVSLKEKLWARQLFCDYYNKFIRLLEKKHISKIIVWRHFLLVPIRALSLAAQTKNIPVLYIYNGLFAHTMCVQDREDITSLTNIRNTRTFYRRYNQKDAIQLLRFMKTYHPSLEPQPKAMSVRNLRGKYHIPNGKKIIFVPMQMPPLLPKSSIYIKDEEEFMNYIVTSCEDEKGFFFVFKLHPNCERILSSRSGNQIIFKNANVRDLIELSDLVVTIGSGAGLEALLFHKKVLCLGDAVYSGMGFTIDLDDLINLKMAIKQALQTPSSEKYSTNFLRFVYELYFNFYFPYCVYPNKNMETEMDQILERIKEFSCETNVGDEG